MSDLPGRLNGVTERQPPAESPWEPHYRAYLDQGRWLLADQQRRRDGFRGAAATLLGFDGIALTLLIGLAPSDPWIAAIALAGALAVGVSAWFAVRALLPRGTDSVGAQDTLDGWVRVRQGTLDHSVTLHFAEMLLTTPEARAGDVDEGDNGEAQVLRSNIEGTNHVGMALARSATSLLVAVTLLIAAVGVQAIQVWS